MSATAPGPLAGFMTAKTIRGADGSAVRTALSIRSHSGTGPKYAGMAIAVGSVMLVGGGGDVVVPGAKTVVTTPVSGGGSIDALTVVDAPDCGFELVDSSWRARSTTMPPTDAKAARVMARNRIAGRRNLIPQLYGVVSGVRHHVYAWNGAGTGFPGAGMIAHSPKPLLAP